MRLTKGHHLAYCTNVHRGETWAEVFGALERHTLEVKSRVAQTGQRFAIGLRLGAIAARELSEQKTLAAFRRWLDQHNCYVFTINGFPYGSFHGTRVKENVYLPDWSSPDRLDYTLLLFRILAELAREDSGGSVSTVPVSFKGFEIAEPDRRARAIAQLAECAHEIHRISAACGKDLHLGLEPEPLCSLETTAETVAFFDELRSAYPGDESLLRRLGVNYDACHLAVEFEDAGLSLDTLVSHQIRISKIHISSALSLNPTEDNLRKLRALDDPVYLHQVVSRSPGGSLARFAELGVALERAPRDGEWRVHFHIPVHHAIGEWFSSTQPNTLDVFNWLGRNPSLCSHLEIETYTWEVLPAHLRMTRVEEQIVAEYDWTLAKLRGARLA